VSEYPTRKSQEEITMDPLSQHTLTAFFRERSDAEEATRELMSAGIAEANVRLVPGKEPEIIAATDTDNDGKGFWESLGDFFFPPGDRELYAEGLRRGGYLVTVSNLTETQHQTALDILDDEGTIDVDEWSDSWRADGWAPTNPGFDSDRAAANAGASQAASTSEGGFAEDRAMRGEQSVGKRDANVGGSRVRSYSYDRSEDNLDTPPRV